MAGCYILNHRQNHGSKVSKIDDVLTHFFFRYKIDDVLTHFGSIGKFQV